MLFCEFTDRNGQRIVLNGFTIEVERYTNSAIGGPRKATINIRGPRDRLWEMIDLLAAEVDIYNEVHEWRWGGYVEDASVSIGTMSVGLTIKNIANRIQVTYTEHTTDQSTQEFTEWAGDGDSIARYGTFESRLTFGDSTLTAAERYRDAMLSISSVPTDSMEIGFAPGDVVAVLNCVGWWETTKRKYFKADRLTYGTTTAIPQQLYRLGYDPEPGENAVYWQRLGERLNVPDGTALAQATFVAQKIGNPTGRLHCELIVGYDESLFTSNSFVIAAVDVALDTLPNDPPTPTITLTSVVVASNVATATKEAHGFTQGTVVVIDGSNLAYANGQKVIASVPNSNTFTFEAFGANATATGTITATGGTNPPPAMPVDVTFNFPNVVIPDAYWVIIAVSSLEAVTTLDDYIHIGTSTNGTGAGAMGQLGDGGWPVLSSAGHLQYQLELTRQTTDLIAERLNSQASLLTDTTIEQPSGIYVSPFEDGQSRLQDTVMSLLNIGSTTSARLMVQVGRGRIAVVSPEPLKSADPMFLFDPLIGGLTNANGIPIAKETCPCGGWAEIVSVPKAYFQRQGRTVVVATVADAIVQRDGNGNIINPITSLSVAALAAPIPASTLLRFDTSDVEVVTTGAVSAGAISLPIHTLTKSIVKGDVAIYSAPSGQTTGPRIFIEEATYMPADDRLEIRARGVRSVWDLAFGS